jgi:iron complex outermembrane receptor protein
MRESHAYFPDPSGVYPQAVYNDSTTWGVTPRFSWSGDIFNRKNNFIIGADFYWAEQDVDSFGGFFIPLTSRTGVSHVARDSYGVYANNEFSVRENLILSLGARYEEVRYDLKQKDLSAFPLAPLDKKIDRSEEAYTAGLSYIYDSNSSVFVRVNRSFRFALVDEVIYIDWITATIKANTDLKPQTGMHYEAGIRHTFTQKIFGSITFFRASIDDEMFYNPATFSNENHPETLHQGVELGAKAGLFEDVTIFGNYTYEEATFESNPYKDNDIPAVPEHKANLGVQIADLFIRA